MNKRAFLVCLSFALANCAGVQRRPSPPIVLDMPKSWASTSPSQIDRKPTSLISWWLRFEDPILTGLIVDALYANTGVQSAQIAIRQARAYRAIAAAGLGPVVTGSTGASRSTAGLANSNSSATSSYTAGLDGSWVMDVYGGQLNALSAQDAALWARVADLGDMQVQVAAEVGLIYTQLRASQAQLAIAQANVASQTQTLQIATWRLRAGLASKIETLQARNAVAQIQAGLGPIQTSIETSAHALSILTGRMPSDLKSILLRPQSVPSDHHVLAIAIPAETLRQRADVRSGEFAILQASGLLGQSEAATKPRFSLGGSLSLSSPKIGTLLNGSSLLSSLFGTISLPIFDGGASKAQVNVSDAGLELAYLTYRATLLKALQEVEDALVILREDSLRLQSISTAANLASQAAELARLRYRAGLIDFQIVLETQRSEYATSDALSRAQAALSTDQINLYKALGGGWTAPASLPAQDARDATIQ